MNRYNPSLRFTGSDGEFEALIELTKLAVYSTVLSYLAGSPDADDVVQETYIEAYFCYGRLTDRDRLTAWLCGIARNLSFRRLKRCPRTAPLEAVSVKAVSDPESGYIKAESRRELLYAVAALPCKVAETVTLFYLAGKSIREFTTQDYTDAKDIKERMYFVSRSETVTVDAGTFYNCLHIKKDETRYGMTTELPACL